MPDPLALLAVLTTLPGAAAAGLLLAGIAGLVMQAAGRRQARRAVTRRLRAADPVPTARSSSSAEAAPHTAPPARPTVLDRVVASATVFTRVANPAQIKQARMRLMRAGYYDPRAVAVFFLARATAAAGFAAAAWTAVSTFLPKAMESNLWLWVFCGAIGGWLVPGFWIGRRMKAIAVENRTGFPDFMDLMGVCANAGMSMEAGLERVSRELADMYPNLGVQLQILCLEVRAGRSLEEALHALADRLDLAEVRAFATLLQQSKELGSSLSDALRVFSDDMRHKRLSMAEEKAYALPAKLSVPVTACILPVVLFVAILPVIIRVRLGLY